jgi:hypothetical protein
VTVADHRESAVLIEAFHALPDNHGNL